MIFLFSSAHDDVMCLCNTCRRHDAPFFHEFIFCFQLSSRSRAEPQFHRVATTLQEKMRLKKHNGRLVFKRRERQSICGNSHHIDEDRDDSAPAEIGRSLLFQTKWIGFSALHDWRTCRVAKFTVVSKMNWQLRVRAVSLHWVSPAGDFDQSRT